jgi:transposase-like protein
MVKNPSPILRELRAATASEVLAVEFMEKHRWGNEPFCPRCGVVDVYSMVGVNGERNKDFRWRCRACKKMFTVRTGSVLEESRLPVRVWVYAFWKACASKKGISALQLSREVEITHRSALFVLRRIRLAMSDPSPAKLKGTVEVDETYVGGKPRIKGQPKEKAAVVAMAERGGNVRFFTMERVTANTVGRAIEENIDFRSRLMTDEAAIYVGIGEAFRGGHHSVKHSAGEYKKAGTDIHSNSVEGVFSLLKRGIYGTFHSVSKRHLGNYLSEFEFRHNARSISDGERVSRAIKATSGKRVTYREAVDMPPWVPRR